MQSMPYMQPDRLPHRPYCSNDLSAGLVIRDQQEALKRMFIQPNGPTHRWRMVFDVDQDMAASAWMGRQLSQTGFRLIRQMGMLILGLSWLYLLLPVMQGCWALYVMRLLSRVHIRIS
jgi:hypothetical protein